MSVSKSHVRLITRLAEVYVYTTENACLRELLFSHEIIIALVLLNMIMAFKIITKTSHTSVGVVYKVNKPKHETNYVYEAIMIVLPSSLCFWIARLLSTQLKLTWMMIALLKIDPISSTRISWITWEIGKLATFYFCRRKCFFLAKSNKFYWFKSLQHRFKHKKPNYNAQNYTTNKSIQIETEVIDLFLSFWAPPNKVIWNGMHIRKSDLRRIFRSGTRRR